MLPFCFSIEPTSGAFFIVVTEFKSARQLWLDNGCISVVFLLFFRCFLIFRHTVGEFASNNTSISRYSFSPSRVTIFFEANASFLISP